MSDARQQAIDAMAEVDEAFAKANDDVAVGPDWLAVLLDAIPGDVHAQLAVNKGALVETRHPLENVTHATLYRLAGKDPQP